MQKQYRYILSVSVRPRGAQGAYVFHPFPVAYPRAAATSAELFDKWLSLLGDEFEPGVMDQVNGHPTKGMHGHQFQGEEI